MDGERVCIPAAWWCEPGATVEVAGRRGVRRIVEEVQADGTFVTGRQAMPLRDWTVPLDVPANALGVLRAVAQKVTGQETPALLLLLLDGIPGGPWWVDGFVYEEPLEWSPSCVPALEGVTDALVALRAIAEHVLGGDDG